MGVVLAVKCNYYVTKFTQTSQVFGRTVPLTVVGYTMFIKRAANFCVR